MIVVLRPDFRSLVNRVFAVSSDNEEIPLQVEFPLRASISVAELEELYGVRLEVPGSLTLDEAVRSLLKNKTPLVGSTVRFREIALHVRELTAQGSIATVGMIILPEAADGEPAAATKPKQ